MKKTEHDKFFQEYQDRKPGFEALMNKGLRTLNTAIERHGIKTHSIPRRIKSFDSCVSKITKKKIEKPFECIKDFVGLRVICLFLSDLDRVEEAINEIFEVLDRKDKTNEYGENVFGYMGTHFIVKLKAKTETDTMPFEIQVRTIAQDAWASVSHHLDYKASHVRDELKRDFYALSGLFYVADTHFSILKQDKM